MRRGRAVRCQQKEHLVYQDGSATEERERDREREAKVRGLQSSRIKQRVMKKRGHETMYILWY